MFTISVAGLKRTPAQERRYQITGNIETIPGEGDEPVPLVSPVVLQLRITNAGDFLWAVGDVKATVRLTCSRCIKEFPLDLEGRFEEKYSLHGGANEDSIEDVAPAADELDFTDQVIETIILSLPMKPLCDEDCKGLCLTCGRDLNTGICGCPQEIGDPRLAYLSGLLNQKEGGGNGGGTQT
ncbi:MAG: DUF177 domain-containing protein [Bacillota bacterium]